MSIDSKNIKTITEEQHIWARLSMYLGSPVLIDEIMTVFHENKFINREEKYSQQTQKLFEEILQNAIDNYVKNPVRNYQIDVDCNSREFSVRNNGFVFGLNAKNNENVSRIFSSLRSSDQYGKKDQQTAGMNGFGAKLVNLCSSLFQMQVQNDGHLFTATWKNRRQEYQSNTVQKSASPYFKIHTRLLDRHTKIEFDGIEIELDFCDLNIELIRKYMIDLSMAFPQISFTLNGEKIPFIEMNNYLAMHNIEQYVLEKQKDLQIYIFRYTNQCLFKRYSLINGIQTFSKDGDHYSCLQKALKEQSKTKANILVGMFFIGQFQGLEYSEQVKTNIKTKMTFALNEKTLQFVRDLTQKEIVRDPKPKFVPKLIEANKVRDKKVSCSLIITEGDSAACLFKNIQKSQSNFFDCYGLFPLKGKILGVKKIGEDAFFMKKENPEIKNLIDIIGLHDIKYNEQNMSTLRYQKIIIATDYDVDGYHICGLFISFIERYWPSLIPLGFLQRFTTPLIVGATKNGPIEFFSEHSFKNDQRKFTNVQYYKGLSSFNDEQAIKMGKIFKTYIKNITPDTDDYHLSIQKLFVEKPIARKLLIQQYEEKGIDFSKPHVSVEYCMHQVVEYSVESLQRAIPSFLDGLKESQRKIVYWVMTHPSMGKLKISQLSGKVSGDLDYHHGETSLQETSIMLAQSFTGTNNCNLLGPDGIFGDRNDPKAYGSPRYISINQQKPNWMNRIFVKDDELIYKYRMSDDSVEIEPENLFPIIPIQMVNGAKGIATGWSTFMPCYSLQDCVDYIRARLTGKQPIQIVPKYNDYGGKIEMIGTVMKNTGAFHYTDNQNGTGNLLINDTVITTSIANLLDFLQENKISAKINDGIFIENISEPMIEKILGKFLVNSQKLENMTFMDGTKVLQYKDVQDFFDDWIHRRLQIYVQRKEAILLRLVSDFMIQWNYNRFVQEDIQQYSNTENFDIKLTMFTPMSEIMGNMEIDLEKIEQSMIQKSNIIQCEDLKQYAYLQEKSVRFYNKFTDDRMKQIRKEYAEYRKFSPTQIWLRDLEQLK